MAIDPSIPLRANAVIDPSQGLNALAGAFEYRDQKRRQSQMDERQSRIDASTLAAQEQQREMNALTIASEKIKAMDARGKRRATSMVLGSVELAPYLENKDINGAMKWAQARKQTIEQAKSIDPTLDTRETDEVIQMLSEGKIDQLKDFTKNWIKVGERLDILKPAPKVTKFLPVYDNKGRIIAQQDAATGETKPDPRASKLLDPEELAQQKEIRAAGKTTISNTFTPNALQPGKTAQGKIDEGLMESGARQMRLDSIAASYKPEYQTIGTKLGVGWAALKEKGGANLSAKDQRSLTEFSQFKADSLNNLSMYIKDITGSAMSIQEAERIRKGMPDAGDGIFDGDSPTQFKSKLDGAIKNVKMAESRLVYLKRNGLSLMGPDGAPVVPLERMPAIINGRGKEIEASLIKADPKADKKALQKAVMRQLGQEFGIAAD